MASHLRIKLSCSMILGLLLVAVSTASAENSTWRYTPKQINIMLRRQRAADARHLRLANAYLTRNQERRNQILPPGAPINSSPILREHQNRFGEMEKTSYLSTQDILLDLGAAIEKGRSEKNLVRLYERISSIMPGKIMKKFPRRAAFKTLTFGQKQKLVKQLSKTINSRFADWYPLISEAILRPPSLNFISDCAAETGYETAGSYSEVSARCNLGDYSSTGLMALFDFPLKNYLTCVKSQGARGTCTMHAIVAAIETQVLLDGGGAENLSEEQGYMRAKLGPGWENRYTDGLGLDNPLSDFDANNYLIRYENVWNYNQSWARSDNPSSSTHQFTDSCLHYSGEMCTEYAFQAEETETDYGPATVYTYTTPALTGGGREVKEYGYLPVYDSLPELTLDISIAFVSSKIPMITCFATFDGFDNSSGYVEYDSSQTLSGGHCVLMIGFISNDDLPSSVTPAKERGYFIFKNSHGTDDNDCGFIYMSYKYLKERGYSVAYLLNVD